jgi:hypothetical protein
MSVTTATLAPLAHSVSRITPDGGHFYWTDYSADPSPTTARKSSLPSTAPTPPDGDCGVRQPTGAEAADGEGHTVSSFYEWHPVTE